MSTPEQDRDVLVIGEGAETLADELDNRLWGIAHVRHTVTIRHARASRAEVIVAAGRTPLATLVDVRANRGTTHTPVVLVATPSDIFPMDWEKLAIYTLREQDDVASRCAVLVAELLMTGRRVLASAS